MPDWFYLVVFAVDCFVRNCDAPPLSPSFLVHTHTHTHTHTLSLSLSLSSGPELIVLSIQTPLHPHSEAMPPLHPHSGGYRGGYSASSRLYRSCPPPGTHTHTHTASTGAQWETPHTCSLLQFATQKKGDSYH